MFGKAFDTLDGVLWEEVGCTTADSTPTEQNLHGCSSPAGSVLRVFQYMQRNPIVSIPATAKKIGVSAPTVAKSLEYMRQLGILRETTGRERHRAFVYEPYLAILNEGTEPLR